MPETKKRNFSVGQKAVAVLLLVLLAAAIFWYLADISLQRNRAQLAGLRELGNEQAQAAERAKKLRESEMERFKEQLRPLQNPGLAGR